jgi:hypothetical protein
VTRLRSYALLALLAAVSVSGARAQDDAATALAKQTQNPVADLISVPLQSNFNLNTGAFNRLQYQGLLQPVVPVTVTEDWNLILRPIIPFLDQPVGRSDNQFGMGDIALQTYLSPRNANGIIWGVGPVGQFPTRTDPILGQGMWGAGPGGVALIMPGPWVIGALVNHVWSIGAPGLDQSAFSTTTLQPFINYNFGHGLALSFVSQMTRNGVMPDGQQWTVPLGGTLSQVLMVGNQPISLSGGAFYNVAHPTGASDWQLRFQVTFLFPKKKSE